jgi:hypothetical protein
MASSASPSTSIHALPGEIRNEIYRLFFSLVLARTTPTAPTGPLPITRSGIQYAPATTFEDITSLFLTDRQIGTEARTLFYGLFFARRHYLIQSRESIYSFSRVPNQRWAQNVHKIHLTANGILQGRKIFNPVKIALVRASVNPTNPTNPTTSLLQARKLQLGSDRIPWNNTFILRRFYAKLTLSGVPTTLYVYQCENERFDVILTGPLGKLDWSMIPLARYTEDSAWGQLLARRERLLIHNGGEIPLHQMPIVGDDGLFEPYVEEKFAGCKLVTEVAVEVLGALGLERPRQEPWDLSWR